MQQLLQILVAGGDRRQQYAAQKLAESPQLSVTTIGFSQSDSEELPEFDYRLKVKAGLTGYAQVYGKYNTTPYDKLQLDLMYIANPSFIEDLKIIFAMI